MNRNYLKVTIHTTTQGAEALAPVLEGIGVQSYSVEDPADLVYVTESAASAVWDFIDPSLEARNGEDVILSFYLPEDEDEKADSAKAATEELALDASRGVYGEDIDFGTLEIETERIYDDWVERSRALFHAFSPIGGVLIRPPWEEVEAADTDTLIVIDPGMAFGTGSHETTSMCLSALAESLDASGGARVLDVGTGSAILAIYAALRGAARVVAVEIDPDAAESARGNIESNGVTDRIELIVGDVCESGVLPEEKFDFILANLTCGLLAILLPHLKNYLAPGGRFILSGLLDTQEANIRETIGSCGLETTLVRHKGEWISVLAS